MRQERVVVAVVVPLVVVCAVGWGASSATPAEIPPKTTSLAKSSRIVAPTSTSTSSVEGSAKTSEGEQFVVRWSAEIEGELLGLETAADRLYVVTLNGSALEVVASDLGDGSVLWERTLTDAAWPGPEYWGSATEYGLVLTFGADAGGHLTLLDADSGETRWDESLTFPAYDVYEQVNDHVALFELSEGDLQFIDLDTTETADAGDYFSNGWVVIGDELARFEDNDLGESVPATVVEEIATEVVVETVVVETVVVETVPWTVSLDDSTDTPPTPVDVEPRSLELGWDPFDPEAPTTPIELPAGTDEVDATDDGRLIVATVGNELVGVLDGEEVWRWTPDVAEIGYIEFLDGLIGVVEVAGGVYTGRAHFARVGQDRIKPFEVVPETFRVDDVWLSEDGSIAAVGVFDTTGGSSSEETIRPAIIELEDGNSVREFPSQINGLAYTGAFGEYVFSASPYVDEQIVIYRANSFEPVASIPYSVESDLIDLGGGIIIYDAGQSTLSMYR